MRYTLSTWLQVLKNMNFEIVKYTGKIEAIKDSNTDTFGICYKIEIYFNYKNGNIIDISIQQGFDTNFNDDLFIDLDVFVKEYTSCFREVLIDSILNQII